VTLVQEGIAAMRGCWRLILRDPQADEDFNFTIDGFWRSFAMAIPVLILAYPMFLSGHEQDVAQSLADGEAAPELRLGVSYFYLLVDFAVWPLVAAFLARLFGLSQNYVPYMIVYNWMSVPTMALAVIPSLLHLMMGSTLLPGLLGMPVFGVLLYISWYIARTCLRTTAAVALAFLLADLALTFGLSVLSR
jgi:hypothetical protein